MKAVYAIIILVILGLAIGFIVMRTNSDKSGFASDKKMIDLPPVAHGNKLLFDAYKNRKTTREFSEKPLSLQVLSNLLWSANGINRPGSKKRTAPSAHNLHVIDIYVFKEDGVFLYHPELFKLELLIEKDLRQATGVQAFVKDVPVNIVYVVDYNKIKDNVGHYEKNIFPSVEVGTIIQNVYLYCASENMATGARGDIDKPELSKLMGLKKNQEILMAQSIGYNQE